MGGWSISFGSPNTLSASFNFLKVPGFSHRSGARVALSCTGMEGQGSNTASKPDAAAGHGSWTSWDVLSGCICGAQSSKTPIPCPPNSSPWDRGWHPSLVPTPISPHGRCDNFFVLGSFIETSHSISGVWSTDGPLGFHIPVS